MARKGKRNPGKQKQRKNPSGATTAVIGVLAAAGLGVAGYYIYTKLAFRLLVNGKTSLLGPVTVSNPGTGAYQVTGAKAGDTVQIVYASSPSPTATTVFSPSGGEGVADSNGTFTFTDTNLHTAPGAPFTFYIAAYDGTSQKYSNWVTVTISGSGPGDTTTTSGTNPNGSSSSGSTSSGSTSPITFRIANNMATAGVVNVYWSGATPSGKVYLIYNSNAGTTTGDCADSNGNGCVGGASIWDGFLSTSTGTNAFGDGEGGMMQGYYAIYDETTQKTSNWVYYV